MIFYYNEDKSVVADRFIRTLNGKIYNKLTVNDNKSYLGYLNKFVDQNNNTDNRSICKKKLLMLIVLL